MKLTLFGYGKTTKAIAKKVGPCSFYDDKTLKPFRDDEGNNVYPSFMFDANKSFLEIPSPGIAPNNALIKQAKNLVSEYDYFAKEMPFSIWISGTNGKTTTTEMITHLLKDKGAVSGGNIGTPLAELDRQKEIWVLETSSFSLHYTNVAKPNLYVLLPISDDHVSWHGSFEAYEEAKLKPLKQLREGEIGLVPKKYAHIQSAGQLIAYEGIEDLASYFELDITRLKFKGAFLLDALLAMAVAKMLFDVSDYALMNTYALAPHRQEVFYDKQKRLWVNDTKATNVDASLQAIENYSDKKLFLILGGDDKGANLHILFKTLQTKAVEVFCIGSNKNKLANLSQEYKLVYHVCKNLNDAISKIDLLHTQESYALLAPAAASLDEFSSYIKRGELFKEKVLSLS